MGEEHDRQIAMTSSQKITEDEKREVNSFSVNFNQDINSVIALSPF